MTFFRLATLLIVVVFSGAAFGEVYRSVDADGNVIYSDKPHAGAEKIEVQKPTIIPSTRNQLKLRPEQSSKQAASYTTIEIAAPANEQTLRNVQSVSVSGRLQPGLQTAFGHKVKFLFDGKPVQEAGRSLNVTINQVERGAHSLQMLVVDRNGKTIASSPVSQFFLHQNFVRPAN